MKFKGYEWHVIKRNEPRDIEVVEYTGMGNEGDDEDNNPLVVTKRYKLNDKVPEPVSTAPSREPEELPVMPEIPLMPLTPDGSASTQMDASVHNAIAQAMISYLPKALHAMQPKAPVKKAKDKVQLSGTFGEITLCIDEYIDADYCVVLRMNKEDLIFTPPVSTDELEVQFENKIISVLFPSKLKFESMGYSFLIFIKA